MHTYTHTAVILDTTTESFPGAVALTELFDDYLLSSQEAGCEVSEVLGNNAVLAHTYSTYIHTSIQVCTYIVYPI
jgi:hypothetical protein